MLWGYGWNLHSLKCQAEVSLWRVFQFLEIPRGFHTCPPKHDRKRSSDGSDILPLRCLKIWLWHSFIIPSLLLMAEATNTLWDCAGTNHTVRWHCCQVFVQENVVLLLITGQSCNFCLYWYLSLWGIFWFCFWTAFLFSIRRAFLSCLDKWTVLNDCFHFFYCPQLGDSRIPVTEGGCVWLWSGALGLSFWYAAFVPETPQLFLLCWEFQLDLWWGNEEVSVFHPLKMCCLCHSVGQAGSSQLCFVRLAASLMQLSILCTCDRFLIRWWCTKQDLSLNFKMTIIVLIIKSGK